MPLVTATRAKLGPNLLSLARIRSVGACPYGVASRSGTCGPSVGRSARHTGMHDFPRFQFNAEKGEERPKEEIGDRKARRRPRAVRRDCARSVAHVCPRGWCVRTVRMYFWIVRLHTRVPSESAFTPDAFSTPQSILRRHLPDQGDGLGGDLGRMRSRL